MKKRKGLTATLSWFKPKRLIWSITGPLFLEDIEKFKKKNKRRKLK